MPAAAGIVTAGVGLAGSIYGANKQADASQAAADAQVQSGRDSIMFQRESRDLARNDLQPYRDWGQNFMPLYTGMMNPQNQANYLLNNPMFQAAIGRSEDKLKNTMGFGGMRGDLQNAITQNYLSRGYDILNNERNYLWNPIQMGQNAAAGQGGFAMNAGQGIGNTMEDIGNAQAAGYIGQANAQAGMVNNLIGSIGAGMNAYNTFRGA